MQPGAQAPCPGQHLLLGASPFGQPPLKFYYFEAQVPPDLELEAGSNAPTSPSPAAPGRVYLTLSCPGLVPTPDEEAPEAPDAQLGACQEGAVGRGGSAGVC